MIDKTKISCDKNSKQRRIQKFCLVIFLLFFATACGPFDVLKSGNDSIKTRVVVDVDQGPNSKPVHRFAKDGKGNYKKNQVGSYVQQNYLMKITKVRIHDIVANELEMEALQLANQLYVKLADSLYERHQLNDHGEFEYGWIRRRTVGTGLFLPTWFPDSPEDEIDADVDDATEESDWCQFGLRETISNYIEELRRVDPDVKRAGSKKAKSDLLNKKIEELIKNGLKKAAEKLLIEYELKLRLTGNSYLKTSGGLILGKRVGGVGSKAVSQEFDISINQRTLNSYRTEKEWKKGTKNVGLPLTAGHPFEAYEFSIELNRKGEIASQIEKALQKLEEEKYAGTFLEKTGEAYGLGGVGKVIGSWIDKRVQKFLEKRYKPVMKPVSGTVHFTRLKIPPDLKDQIHQLKTGTHTIRFEIESFGKNKNNARRYYGSDGKLENPLTASEGSAVFDMNQPKWVRGKNKLPYPKRNRFYVPTKKEVDESGKAIPNDFETLKATNYLEITIEITEY